MAKFQEARGEDIIDEYKRVTGFRLPPHIAKDFIPYIEKKYPLNEKN